MMPCDSAKSNSKIQFDFYLSKTTVNTTEIKGNISALIKIDDSLDVSIVITIGAYFLRPKLLSVGELSPQKKKIQKG